MVHDRMAYCARLAKRARQRRRLMYNRGLRRIPAPERLHGDPIPMKPLLAALLAFGVLATSPLQGATMSDSKTVTTASGLKYEDVKQGTGETATAGKMVS